MEEKKEECSSCKKFTKSQWFMITISFYMLFSSIYGSVILFKKLMELL